MSDCKCEHNDHSHMMIWFAIWWMLFIPSMDCSGEHQRTKSDISRLESKVSSLESEVDRLKRNR